jgi:hypothetical protein
MKRLSLFVILSFCLLAPSWLMAQYYDHGEVGIFADYMNFSPTDPNINFVGVGGRVGFNVHPNVALEAEMSYDFSRNFTSTFSNGVTSTFVTTNLRPLTGLFGPKFQFGTSSAFRAFVTGKVGFIDLSSSSSAVTAGTFGNTVAGVGNSATHFAMYPGVGIEGFWGPVGLRLDVGDEIYLNNGTFNNFKVSFGPHFRF